MTTICSDGITVAADGLVLAGDEPVIFDRNKIVRVDGIVLGFVGNPRYHAAAIEWWANDECAADARPNTPDGAEHAWDLVVFKVEGATLYRHDSSYPFTYPYPFATGSGEEYAIAALMAGVSPWHAIEIAARRNIRTGGIIRSLPIIADQAMQEAAE